ncbi:hypothetical protein B1F74_23615, partial [Pseudomonas syringae]
QSHGLKFELKGVFNAICLGLSHVVSLRLLRHLARDTFFRGKVRFRLFAEALGSREWEECRRDNPPDQGSTPANR